MGESPPTKHWWQQDANHSKDSPQSPIPLEERSAKLEELKVAFESKTYKVSVGELADKLIHWMMRKRQ